MATETKVIDPLMALDNVLGNYAEGKATGDEVAQVAHAANGYIMEKGLDSGKIHPIEKVAAAFKECEDWVERMTDGRIQLSFQSIARKHGIEIPNRLNS